MRGSSLATRLFLSATAWVVVILVITGVILSSVYRSASERAFDRRLNLYLRTLVAEVATPDEPADHQFQSLGEPLFELPPSGSDTSTGRSRRACAWSSGRSISAPTANSSSVWPATPARFPTRSAPS